MSSRIPIPRILPVLIAFIPFIFLVAMVVHCAADIPFWDAWGFVATLRTVYDGTLSFRDLWAQHCEHRPFFPRLIMLGLARWTGWNTCADLAVSMSVGIAIFFVLIRQVGGTVKSAGSRPMPWAVPAIALMVFSASQWENWIWGWNMQIFLSVFASVAGIVLLARPQVGWKHMVAAMALGVLAVYSYANGFVYWGIGIPMLWLSPGSARRDRGLRVGAWIAVLACVLASYLYRYHHPVEYAGPLLVLHMPLEYAKYVFVYLAGSLMGHSLWPTVLTGLGGCVLLAFTTWTLIRVRGVPFQALVPYLSLSAYATGSAAMSGLGRTTLGSMSGLTPRYTTISMLFWISNFVLLHLLLATGGRNKAHDKGLIPDRTLRTVAVCAMLLIVSLAAAKSITGSLAARCEAAKRVEAGHTLMIVMRRNPVTVTPDEDRMLKRLFPRVGEMLREATFVREHRLSVFRNE